MTNLSTAANSGRAGSVDATLAVFVQLNARWWGSAILVAGGWSLLLLVTAGLSTGLGLAAGFGDWSYLGHGLTATLAYSPAVIMLVGVAVVLSSITPRVVTLAWPAVAWGVVVCLRADLLNVPGWARRLSPLNWMGGVPREDWHRPAALMMTVLAVSLAATSTLMYRRRDLRAG